MEMSVYVYVYVDLDANVYASGNAYVNHSKPLGPP